MTTALEAIVNDEYFKFDLRELICPHAYERYITKLGWSDLRIYDMFDIRLLEMLLYIRKALNRPITVNNWHTGGAFDERGIRCHLCDLVASKNRAYLSSHVLGMGLDFDVLGMTAEEVRLWLEAHASSLPYPIRIEDWKNWVHLDMHSFRPLGWEKVIVYRFLV